MGSFQRSKRSDKKQRTVEVRWGIFCENFTFFFLRAVVNIPIQTHNFAMTVLSQDDHLTAGAWGRLWLGW